MKFKSVKDYGEQLKAGRYLALYATIKRLLKLLRNKNKLSHGATSRPAKHKHRTRSAFDNNKETITRAAASAITPGLPLGPGLITTHTHLLKKLSNKLICHLVPTLTL